MRRFCVGALGRLTAKNGAFRPGQVVALALLDGAAPGLRAAAAAAPDANAITRRRSSKKTRPTTHTGIRLVAASGHVKMDTST